MAKPPSPPGRKPRFRSCTGGLDTGFRRHDGAIVASWRLVLGMPDLCGGDHRGHSYGRRVGETDGKLGKREESRAHFGPAVQKHDWLATRITEHLDLPPADASHSGAKGFHHRLFGRKARC
jgi:hypothetical protein